MAMTAFCTDLQLERYMSSYGVISYSDNNQDGATDTLVVDDCKTYGMQFLVGILAQRYTYALLTTAPMMAELAAIIILRELCLRRGNAPPASLEARYHEITDKDALLDQIAKGRVQLVDTNGDLIRMNTSNLPSHSNLMIDRRFSERQQRVISGSSNTTPSKLRRDMDLNQEFDI